MKKKRKKKKRILEWAAISCSKEYQSLKLRMTYLYLDLL